MPRPSPLPDSLGGAFRVGAALQAGVTRSRLRASDIASPTHGVRTRVLQPAARHDRSEISWRSDERRDDIRRRVRETAPALLPAQFFSHETALILFGCPMPRAPYAPSLHVSAHRPASQPRRREWVGHRLGALTHSTRLIEGVRVEAPARAWVHAGELWEVDDLVAAADFLLHPRTGLVTIEDLRTAAAGSSGSVRSRLRTAADAARRGSESSEETRLRLAILRAALPEPLLNHELRSPGGTLIARLDLAYPRYRVAVEYDGRVHAEHVAQFRRDADRWDAIRAAGWQHVRILAHHLRPDPGVAVDKVTTALLAGGWTPSRR